MGSPDRNILIPDFSLIVDSREQAPFRFRGLKADSKHRKKDLVVRIVNKALKAGDYSLDGLEDRVAVERKSREDAFATWISDRDSRGIPQLNRLSAIPNAFVVLECTLGQIAEGPLRPGIDPELRRRQGKSLYRSILAWMQRYPTIHWVPCDSRRLAEVTTFRILERFWKELNTEQDSA